MTDIQSLIARSSLGTDILVTSVIIAGSRGIDLSLDRIHEAMDSWLDDERPVVPNEIVSGNARGVDRCGERWAESVGLPVKRFPVTPSDWQRLGKRAGPLRNHNMAVYGGALLAFWDGQSNGTRDMIDRMRGRKKPFLVVRAK